ARQDLGIFGDLLGEERKRIFNEWNKKLDLLFQHFEISTSDPDCWQLLATALALKHVRGFHLVDPRRRRGRRKSWTVLEAKALLNAIEAHSVKRTLKARISAAMKQPNWRWGKNIASIQTRYHEAKKGLAHSDVLPPMAPTLGLGAEWMHQRGATKKQRG